jgi:hypothetical protein
MSATNEPRIEYAIRIDCEKNGCTPPHYDNGDVIFLGDDVRFQTVNGHACTVMSRVIPAWEDDPDYA